MLSVAASRGVSVSTCLDGTGISLQEQEICVSQELRVAQNLANAVGPAPGLGITVGQRMGLRAYGVWGFALLTSPTLRHASDLGLRYLPLTYALASLRLEVTASEVSLVVSSDAPFLVEREIATIAGLVRSLLGASPSMHVELRLPPSSVYSSMLGVPVVFDAPRNALVADASVLEQPLPQSDPVTMAACEQACRTLLTRRVPASLSGAVRSLVASGVTDADAIAARLHLSARTLRRRLALEHTSLRLLVSETRRSAAFSLLVKGCTVEQVSLRLGYTDAATFIRAFRRWTGTTPGAWRCAAECR